MQSKKIYDTEFECVLLKETAEYFRQESNQLITDSACSDYLKIAQKRLTEEYQRINEYLCPSTEPKLIKAFLDEYLSEQNSLTLLKMESSGLVFMIRNNQIQNLSLLFTMFTRREDSFEKLRKCLSEFVIEEGNKLVRDE